GVLCCSDRGSWVPPVFGTEGGVATAADEGGETVPVPGLKTGNSSNGLLLPAPGVGACARGPTGCSTRLGGFSVGGSGIAGRGTTGEIGGRDPSSEPVRLKIASACFSFMLSAKILLSSVSCASTALFSFTSRASSLSHAPPISFHCLSVYSPTAARSSAS